MKRTPIPATVLEKHVAIVGKTGSGKTNTAKLAVEQAFDAGARVCILDPIKSDWWGITSSADGKHAGMPFQILGGPRGHVPLHEQAGAAIGQLVGEGKLRHSIIDMADFGPGGHQKFFIDFAQALFRHASGVVYLVVEEAHIFAPKERAGIGQENLAIHWMSKIASAARSKGVRLIVCTQRTQKLHNDALGSCDTIIAHRLVLPADQKSIVDWLKNNTDPATLKKIVSSLASLRTGQGWICSGELGIVEQQSFPLIRTFDNSKTPSGDAAAIDVATAQVDLDALRAIVGEAVKEAEANDPKKLKARIAELEAQIAEKQLDATSSELLDDLEVAQVERDELRNQNAALRRELDTERSRIVDLVHAAEIRDTSIRSLFMKSIEPVSAALQDASRFLVGAVRGLNEELQTKYTMASSQHGAVESSPVPNVSPQNGTLARGRDEDRGPHPRAGGGGNRAAAPKGTAIGGPLQSIINAVRFWNSVGVSSPSRVQVAVVAGYTATSGTFRNYLAEARNGHALIEYTGDGIRLTDAGRSASSGIKYYNRREMRDEIRGRMTGPQSKMLGILLEHSGKSVKEMARTHLAELSGYEATSGTFRNYLAEMKGLGLITYPKKTTVAPAELLFPNLPE